MGEIHEIGQAILDSDDRLREECKEWGQEFWIQELTSVDCDWLDDAKISDVMKMSKVVVRGACAHDGARLFKDQSAQGLSARKSVQSLQRVSDKILDLSGLTEKAQAAQAKNSDATPKPECGTDSASGSESPISAD